MTAALNKTPDGTLEFTITIPWKDIEKSREEVVEDMVKNANLAGFRKGKAPRNLVEKQLDPEKVREEILRKLLPVFYVEAIKEHNVNPILTPRIRVTKIDEGKDWEFNAYTCEVPQINLGKYKDAVQKITAKSKIVLPGKDLQAGGQDQQPKLDDIMKALVESVEITIPNILLDQEVDRTLAQTLDEVKKLGLNLDQYLASTNRTAETLREEYKKKAEQDIKVEFALQKIAEEEKITVEDKEIEEAIQKSKDENERKHLESNRYLLASILRQQKTLDFLKTL